MKSALQLALTKLSRKAMHSQEVRRVLTQKGFSEEDVEAALQELTRLGVLNDGDYEAQFVKRLERQHKSRRQILLKATQLGLPLDAIRAQLGSEDEVMKALIRKRYPVLMDKNASYQERQQALGALYRRGFYGRASFGDTDSLCSDEC